MAGSTYEPSPGAPRRLPLATLYVQTAPRTKRFPISGTSLAIGSSACLATALEEVRGIAAARHGRPVAAMRTDGRINRKSAHDSNSASPAVIGQPAALPEHPSDLDRPLPSVDEMRGRRLATPGGVVMHDRNLRLGRTKKLLKLCPEVGERGHRHEMSSSWGVLRQRAMLPVVLENRSLAVPNRSTPRHWRCIKQRFHLRVP